MARYVAVSSVRLRIYRDVPEEISLCSKVTRLLWNWRRSDEQSETSREGVQQE